MSGDAPPSPVILSEADHSTTVICEAEGPAVSSSSPDHRALVAIDLGAESCRVSLLRWQGAQPSVQLVHRFPNAPRQSDGGLRWNLSSIEQGLQAGLRQAAALAPEGIRSLAVDGWAVDYVRLSPTGQPLADPFCYRDERTLAAEAHLHSRIAPGRLRGLTGIEQLRINTLYQLQADRLANTPAGPWLNLPEYILNTLGAPPVAELTNASHTQLLHLETRQWAEEIFTTAALDPAHRPQLVLPGTILGKLTGPLAQLPAFRDTILIAPACHDTASAIAGIPAHGDDWAYISSGTWSLVGTPLDTPINTAAVCADNFTNLAAAGGKVLFHKNVNGMWLLRQCMDAWTAQGQTWSIPGLIEAAALQPTSDDLLDLADPGLLLAGDMPARFNRQLRARGLSPVDETDAPRLARLIFESLAARYAEVLARIAHHTGKTFRRVFIVGGGSRNALLNRLTAEATGLEVVRGSEESSTLGNFAIQLAALDANASPSAEAISRWAVRLH